MSVTAARSAIASALFAAEVPERLGGIALAVHQRAAARRLVSLLDEHGGALLADDVGLGKTFAALAVARRYARVAILHPACLRAMWSDALRRAGIGADLVSYESLSRSRVEASWDLVILDEAHHARSTSARRYRRVADVCARAHTLLLTATPVPNRLEELRALFSLFLGERAASLDLGMLRALIVRRPEGSIPLDALPDVGATRWIDAPADSVTLEMLRALPDPVGASDDGDGGALRLFGLARQWASSRGALRAALRRRLATTSAIQETLASGRVPSRSELAAWLHEEGTLQLAMPGLLAPARGPEAGDLRVVADAAARHGEAVAALLAHLRQTPDPDAVRARCLAAIRSAHPGERVLAFSEFAETVHAYWRYLRHEPAVARLTARGGEIASGSLSRDEVLRRFAPAGQRRASPRAIEAITLLVTTDLLAEGVDLRDATVIVHLDLPWSPARLEQRVGRARRMGSRAPRITVHAFHAPRGAEQLLELERRLLDKGTLAQRTVGAGAASAVRAEPSALTGRSESAGPSMSARLSDAERYSALLDRIASWDGPSASCEGAPLLAELPAVVDGWLALVTVAGKPRLVAALDDVVGDSPAQLERAVVQVDVVDESVPVPTLGTADPYPVSEEARTALARAARWAAERDAEAAAALQPARSAAVSRRALARIQRTYAGTSPDRRASLGPLATAARAVVGGRLSAGQEYELRVLADDTSLDDERWLGAVVALASGTSRDACADTPASPQRTAREPVRVLIVFRAAGATGSSRASTTPS